MIKFGSLATSEGIEGRPAGSNPLIIKTVISKQKGAIKPLRSNGFDSIRFSRRLLTTLVEPLFDVYPTFVDESETDNVFSQVQCIKIALLKPNYVSFK